MPDIYFYKLHGSTDWYDDLNGRLTFTDAPNTIPDDKAAIIFGTSYKLQYRDPFLFLAYEFRKWVLDCKLIICIGYGFGDPHINKIIQQALSQNSRRLLLSVSPFEVDEGFENYGGEDIRKKQQEVALLLDYKNVNQIVCENYPAALFMNDNLNREHLGALFPPEEQPFPVLP